MLRSSLFLLSEPPLLCTVISQPFSPRIEDRIRSILDSQDSLESGFSSVVNRGRSLARRFSYARTLIRSNFKSRLRGEFRDVRSTLIAIYIEQEIVFHVVWSWTRLIRCHLRPSRAIFGSSDRVAERIYLRIPMYSNREINIAADKQISRCSFIAPLCIALFERTGHELWVSCILDTLKVYKTRRLFASLFQSRRRGQKGKWINRIKDTFVSGTRRPLR